MRVIFQASLIKGIGRRHGELCVLLFQSYKEHTSIFSSLRKALFKVSRVQSEAPSLSLSVPLSPFPTATFLYASADIYSELSFSQRDRVNRAFCSLLCLLLPRDAHPGRHSMIISMKIHFLELLRV